MECSVNHANLKVKFCPSCGMNISNAIASPEVQNQDTATPQIPNMDSPGQEFVPSTQPTRAPTNTFAIIGFVTSLLCCGMPIGIIFSALALGQINKNPNQGGKGLATAGLIISILGTSGSVIYLIASSIGASGY